MITIRRYSESSKKEWDNLVAVSRVDTFLFYRDFMEYHADRFDDCSFLIYRKDKLQALMPGNIEDNIYYSHQGLTYGGLISLAKLTLTNILEIFNIINSELKVIGVKEVVYKALPLIYQSIPSQEDIYALFKLNAQKIACNISSTIYLNNKIPFTESRKHGLRKAIKEGVTISESSDFKSFWSLLEDNLINKHTTKPVHSYQEIILLRDKFPENIKLFVTNTNSKISGGTVLFVMKDIVHVQYISANLEGKKVGALDLLFDELINTTYAQKKYFDFGQSTEQYGNYLNENLIFQKEGFGGRGICYDIYRYHI